MRTIIGETVDQSLCFILSKRLVRLSIFRSVSL